MEGSRRVDLLDGEALRGIIAAGTVALERNVEAVNALNVFPVPDGDTGTNMLLTLRATGEELAKAPDAPMEATLQAIARGALMGARGNSGVILSRFLRGLARTLDGHQEADAPLMAQAFQQGAAAAYKAVSDPVEGTILTVIRCTGEAMEQAAATPDADLTATFQRALEACQAAVLKTPEQLPVLREAGVVDAGGQGFALFLEAALRYLQGAEVESLRLETVQPAAHVQESFLAATDSELYGYCTQLLISGDSLDPDALRVQVDAVATSTVVVGDDSLVKVHAHTFDPGPILSLAVSVGTLSQVSIENIDQQHQEFQEARRSEAQTMPLAVVAVAWGQGLQELFRSLGANAVLVGGQTMNPSCQELLDALEPLGAEAALILPNNGNVLPAAQQAADLSPKSIRVIPTRNIPQGIAAMLAYSPEQTLEANAQAMERALTSVRTGELVTAVRDAKVDGRPVAAGEVMALLDSTLVASDPSCVEALAAMVGHAEPGEGALVTLYWGGETRQPDAEAAAQRLRQEHPAVEVELVYGGQPHYHYLLSIE